MMEALRVVTFKVSHSTHNWDSAFFGGRGEEQRKLGERCIGVVAEHGKFNCINIQ